jgi:hypothetical protein
MDSNHRFYSVENIVALVELINQQYEVLNGTTFNFVPDKTFTEQLIVAANDYPQYLITADPQEGINMLNDIMVRRAMKAFTKSDTAGQYYAGNILYRDSRSFRNDDDGTEDHTRQNSAVTLAGNVYQRHNARFQAEQAQMRVQHLNTQYEDRFVRTKARPTAMDDFKDLL